MSQLRHNQAKLEAENVSVKVVTFDSDLMAIAYIKNTELTWPLILDPDLKLYSAYGMERGSWWDMYKPVSIWNYLKLIFAGKGPGKPGRDWRQLGGDILIDPNGIVRLHYISANPHNRPSVEAILDLARR